MIEIDNENKIFNIKNKYISYIFHVTKEGVLEHLYYGSKLDDIKNISDFIDIGFDWTKTYFSSKNQKEEVYEESYYYDKAMYEVPTYALMDTRKPAFAINNNKLDIRTDFRFLDYKIYKGKPVLNGLPFIKNDDNKIDSLEITLKDEYKNIYLILTYSIIDDLPIIIRNSKIINKESKGIDIKIANSLSLDLPSKNYELIHFPGDWVNERELRREKITEGTKIISSKLGRSSHEHNPFIFLVNPETNDDFGEAYGFSFLYSGNFAFNINVSKLNTTRVTLGMNDDEFSYHLKFNGEFELPEGIMVYSNNGLNFMTQKLHDLIRDYIIRPYNKDIKESIVLNSWEGCYMDFDTSKIINFIKEGNKIGANLFVLDDGWFGKRDDDSCSLGDWEVNTKKIDLKKIIDFTHENNMFFGLWFEPEMVNPNSELFKNHKDFILGDLNRDLSLSRHQLCLDFSNPKCVDYIFKSMCKILDNYKIDYIKWDHNRNILEHYSSYLGTKRSGEVYHRLTLGFYDLISRLKKRYPSILFQGCASGGARFDLGMLYYFPEIWTSDETDPIKRIFIQYNTSYMYPLLTMGAHISKNPITSYKTKGEIALFGTYGLELDPTSLNEKEKAEILKCNKLFKDYHNLINSGNLYRLSSPNESNISAFIIVAKDKKEAILFYMNILKESQKYRFIRLKGLDNNINYLNSYNNSVHKGEFYMKQGLNLSGYRDEFASNVIIFKEDKNEIK